MGNKFNGLDQDYCTLWPERWRHHWINECCKAHDNDCGEAGDWKFASQQKRFYNCLLSKGISKKWAVIITLGGAIGCAVKYPFLAIQKVWYRIKNHKKQEGIMLKKWEIALMITVMVIATIIGAIGMLIRYAVVSLWEMNVLIVKEMIRLWPVLLLTMITLYIFMSGMYKTMSPPIQAVAMKTLLTVSGILVAHIIRKALLPKINWNNDHNWQLFVASYSMYLIIPYCFAMGG